MGTAIRQEFAEKKRPVIVEARKAAVWASRVTSEKRSWATEKVVSSFPPPPPPPVDFKLLRGSE